MNEHEEFEDSLIQGRPTPAPGFRGALGRRLRALDPGFGPRPEHLVLTVATWLLAGILVLALALGLALGRL